MKFQRSEKIVRIVAINLALFIFAFSLIIIPRALAKQPQNNQSQLQTQITPEQLLQQAERLFQRGRLLDASNILQQAIKIYKQRDDNLRQATAQANLSVALEQLGSWQQATEAINTSLNLLDWHVANYALKVNNPKSELIKVLAPTLDILAGQQRSTRKFPTQRMKQLQRDSVLKVRALRSLGNVQQQLGKLDKSQQTLQHALKIAPSLQLPQEISLTEFSLGNTTFAQGNVNDAIIHYQNAANERRLTHLLRPKLKLIN